MGEGSREKMIERAIYLLLAIILIVFTVYQYKSGYVPDKFNKGKRSTRADDPVVFWATLGVGVILAVSLLIMAAIGREWPVMLWQNNWFW